MSENELLVTIECGGSIGIADFLTIPWFFQNVIVVVAAHLVCRIVSGVGLVA